VAFYQKDATGGKKKLTVRLKKRREEKAKVERMLHLYASPRGDGKW
jgi:hypothetical protein